MEAITAEKIIEKLNLIPLPEEGGFFRQTWKTAEGTLIYYLVTPESWSTLHLLDIAECWHFYAGDPLKQLQLHADGTAERFIFSNSWRTATNPSCSVRPEAGRLRGLSKAASGPSWVPPWHRPIPTTASGFRKRGCLRLNTASIQIL